MATHRKVHTNGGVFFCTFTCHKWLPLFQEAGGYDLVYKWMDVAIEKGVAFHAYVIMPNHVHVLLSVPEGLSLNKLFSNAKRFMAYGVIAKLREASRVGLLGQLQNDVSSAAKDRGQQHHVFKTSTDIRECVDAKMIQQKMDYIHANPVSGKWQLVEDAQHYEHSSFGFYEGLGARPVVITPI